MNVLGHSSASYRHRDTGDVVYVADDSRPPQFIHGTAWERLAPSADPLRGAVAKARAEQREATIRHAVEFLDSLGRSDLGRALARALGRQ